MVVISKTFSEMVPGVIAKTTHMNQVLGYLMESSPLGGLQPGVQGSLGPNLVQGYPRRSQL